MVVVHAHVCRGHEFHSSKYRYINLTDVDVHDLIFVHSLFHRYSCFDISQRTHNYLWDFGYDRVTGWNLLNSFGQTRHTRGWDSFKKYRLTWLPRWSIIWETIFDWRNFNFVLSHAHECCLCFHQSFKRNRLLTNLILPGFIRHGLYGCRKYHGVILLNLQDFDQAPSFRFRWRRDWTWWRHSTKNFIWVNSLALCLWLMVCLLRAYAWGMYRHGFTKLTNRCFLTWKPCSCLTFKL
jgi:hypothetical protein